MASNPSEDSKLFYTPQQAARALEMGLDEVEDWMAKGRLKYTTKGARCKRRVWRDDLLAFACWFREEYLACPSTSPEIKPGNRKASSGNMTSKVVALDFQDRSTLRRAPRGPAKSRRRKRSLKLGSAP